MLCGNGWVERRDSGKGCTRFRWEGASVGSHISGISLYIRTQNPRIKMALCRGEGVDLYKSTAGPVGSESKYPIFGNSREDVFYSIIVSFCSCHHLAKYLQAILYSGAADHRTEVGVLLTMSCLGDQTPTFSPRYPEPVIRNIGRHVLSSLGVMTYSRK